MKSIMPYISPGMKDRCIVCGAFAANYFASVGGRIYRRCDACQATFLDPAQRVPPDEEYARYCQHRNDPEDVGYRRFLSKLVDPLLKRLAPGADGLDYGCGPGPVLSGMLREAGHRMRLFDPFFLPRSGTARWSVRLHHLHRNHRAFPSAGRGVHPVQPDVTAGRMVGGNDLFPDRRCPLRFLALPPRPDPRCLLS